MWSSFRDWLWLLSLGIEQQALLPMASPVVVSKLGLESAFLLSKLERQKLYRTRRRIPVNGIGESCTRAALSDDGAVLITAGMTSQGWLNANARQWKAERSAPTATRTQLPAATAPYGPAICRSSSIRPAW